MKIGDSIRMLYGYKAYRSRGAYTLIAEDTSEIDILLLEPATATTIF